MIWGELRRAPHFLTSRVSSSTGLIHRSPQAAREARIGEPNWNLSVPFAPAVSVARLNRIEVYHEHEIDAGGELGGRPSFYGAPSFAQDKASQKFVKEAIEGNLAEVQMGQLAQKNGNSDGVRSFGQMLEKDHTDAKQKATAAANSLGVTPPTEPSSNRRKTTIECRR